MTSLNKLTVRYTLVLALCLSLAVFAGYRVLEEMQRQQATLLTETAATQITDLIKRNRGVLRKLARRKDVIASMQLGEFSTLEQEAENLTTLMADARKIRFIPRTVAPEPTATPPLTQADVAFIRRSADEQGAPLAEFHLLGKRSEHFDLAVPVRDARARVLGYVHASISSVPIRRILRNIRPKANYMELRQARRARGRAPAEVVIQLGNARYATTTKSTPGSTVNNVWDSTVSALSTIGVLSSREPVTSRIAGATWTLALWPQTKTAPLFTGKRLTLLLVIIAAALALLAASLNLSWRVVAFVNHDIKSLARIFRDIRESSIRVNYPMELAEFTRIFKYLRDSGKEMVIEKNIFKDMGLVDHLSQLNNRRHFEKKLKELFDMAKTNGYSSVLIIDLDHFKSVNDRFGHDAGDALIVQFASALRRYVRQTDFLARLGGDEFCVIYTYTGLEQASRLAERLRQRLPRELKLTAQAVHQLRWTGGLSAMCDEDEKSDDVLWRADQGLIQAKKAGRNTTRVVGHAPVVIKKKKSQSG